MIDADYELKTRAVNLVVYRVYVAASVVALVVCPLVVWLVGKVLESDAAVFGIGLVAAVLVMGVPLFLVLNWAEDKWSQLRFDQDEDKRAETWARINEFKRKNGVKDDQDGREV